MARRVSWSEDLPKELLEEIGKCVDAQFDIIRFRSVCTKWRKSLPSPRSNSRLLHDPNSQNPLPGFDSDSDSESLPDGRSLTLLTTTVCILNQYPISSPISKPWLIKLVETQEKKLRIVNPVSDAPVKDLPTTFPKFMNLLDYSILEVNRGYICKDALIRLPWDENELFEFIMITKVVILPESDWFKIDEDDNFMILFLCTNGLFLLRIGDKECRPVNKDEDEFHCDDIAVYEGCFYVVDRWGTLSSVDYSSSQLIKHTLPIVNGGSKKHLVVYSEDLYVVDRYNDRAPDAKAIALKVYKWDKDWGWKEVRSLDDRMLIIGKQLNFFVPIKELSGCKGNCIYFIDENRPWYSDEDDALIGSTGHGIAVFNLADGRIRNLSSFSGYSEMFWPPPTWFTAC
ncbi:hypothetical protein REPUB_Repub10bG0183600 [Reevesia pubescens]